MDKIKNTLWDVLLAIFLGLLLAIAAGEYFDVLTK
tara:strand:+ start:254 stop:358 length:105 start_codon:yes stop_codon:yes gene_type:complete